jgi:cell division FtsZ-interacting protein ZapD
MMFHANSLPAVSDLADAFRRIDENNELIKDMERRLLALEQQLRLGASCTIPGLGSAIGVGYFILVEQS